MTSYMRAVLLAQPRMAKRVQGDSATHSTPPAGRHAQARDGRGSSGMQAAAGSLVGGHPLHSTAQNPSTGRYRSSTAQHMHKRSAAAAQRSAAQHSTAPAPAQRSPCSAEHPLRSVWMARAEDRSHTRAVPSAEAVTTNRAQGSIARAVTAPVWPAGGGEGGGESAGAVSAGWESAGRSSTSNPPPGAGARHAAHARWHA